MASDSEKQACYLSGEPTGSGGGRRRREGEAREEVCGGVMGVESEAVARGKQVFVPSHHIADGCAAGEAIVESAIRRISVYSACVKNWTQASNHTTTRLALSSPFWSREDTLRPKIEGSVYAWHL